MSKRDVYRVLPVITTCAAFFFACVQADAGSSASIARQAPAGAVESASNHMPPDPLAAMSAEPRQEDVGDSLMARKRYQAAIEAYKKTVPVSAAVWNKMGIAYQLLSDPEDAANCYRRSLKMDRRNASVLNNLGTIYDAEKRYGDAERMYHDALRIDAKSALIRKNLGTALIAAHKYKKGWAEYQKALAIDPQIFDQSDAPRVSDPASLQDRGAMNYMMARGCAQAGKTDCAVNYLRMALIEGYTNPKKIALDRDFAALHGQPAYEELLEQQTKR